MEENVRKCIIDAGSKRDDVWLAKQIDKKAMEHVGQELGR